MNNATDGAPLHTPMNGQIISDGPGHTAPVRAPDARVYSRPDGLRYDPDLIMNPPIGRALRPGDVLRAPEVTTVSGGAAAQALMFAQFPLDPKRLSAMPPSRSTKLSSAQRRAAKIAAGKLKVEGGKIVG